MTDRFDLEEKIMNCWRVTDDIDMVATMISNAHMKPQDQDKFMNVLIGMKELYNARFDALFSTFEILVSEGHFKNMAWNPNAFEGLDDLLPDQDKDEMP